MGATQSAQKSAEAVQGNASVELEKTDVPEYSTHLLESSKQAKRPLSDNGSICSRNVQEWEDKAMRDLKIQLARTILVDTDFKTALVDRHARVADAHVFNLQLDFVTSPITNQKSSGRCWLFATTNVLRYSVMQKLDLKEFQLSQVSFTSLGHATSCL